MKKLFYLAILLIGMLTCFDTLSQGVAINNDNSTPDASAMLDVKSTNQGILFPRMSSAERDAIQNPADGLHIFNTNSGSLEYFDLVFNSWIAYCRDCAVFTDTLKSSGPDTTFFGYSLPQAASGFKKIILIINSNVTIAGGYNGINQIPVDAIDLSNSATGSNIIIKNYGKIIGHAGKGGTGGNSFEQFCWGSPAGTGNPGGNAILSKQGTKLTLYNYGTIAGGGGGGGGGGAGTYPGGNTGGGGGGGAGFVFSENGGNKGLEFYYFISGCIENENVLGQSGQSGTLFTGGTGGNGGQSGGALTAGYAGGNGGGLGQPGLNGIDSFQNPGGPGGQPGKAISGNTGNNTVINQGGGVVYGVID